MVAGDTSLHGRCSPFASVPAAYCGIQSEITSGQMAAFLLWCVGFVALSFAWLMGSGRARVQR